MSGNVTHLSNIKAQGTIESVPQGLLIGAQTSMPEASETNKGAMVLYTGETTSSYTKGKYYTSTGTAWVLSDASPESITVDSALSTTSANPVQNKVITATINGLTKTDNNFSDAYKTKLDGIESGAQVNVVETVKVNGSALTPSSKAVNIDLSNYATKSDVSSIPKFAIQVVESLPTSGISTSTIYLKSNSGSSPNIYDEYIYVNGAWEKIGTTEVDLSGYVPTSRTINGKKLEDNITLTASDVGALASNGTAVAATKATNDGSDRNIVDTYQVQLPATGSSTQPIYVSSKGTVAACSLGAASTMGVSTSVTENDGNLVTGGAVYSAINEISVIQFTLKVTYTGASDCSGITVTATPTSGATATVQGTTNSSGVAYLAVRQNATYTISSSKTGYTFTSTPSVTCEDLTTEVSISCYIPGSVTVTVTDEKTSVVGRTVTAKSGSTTKSLTISSGSSVTFTGLAAGSWTFTSDYPSGATGATSQTITVANNGTYNVTIAINYNEVYGFRIAISTSDPSSRVTYPQTIFGETNKAYGFTPASGTGASCMNSWDGCSLISGIKRQKGSGSSWTDVSNTAAWSAGSGSTDMMTYVPTWYMKATNDGTNIDIAFSQEQLDDTWKDYAGSVGTNRVGHFRVGCFGGYVSSSNLYSRGSVKPTVSTSITDFITYAKARGTGYDIMTWYQWFYLTALAVLLYKSTNLQSAMAQGYVGGSAVQTESSLTWSNSYGMAGSTSTTAQMSFFWIQNLWGNMYQFVGGAKTNSSYKLLCQTGYSSVTESDFDITTGLGPFSSLSGYISKVTGTTESGFFPTEVSGSSSTYFADYGYVLSSNFPFVGGGYLYGDNAGPFHAYFYNSATDTGSDMGSRLSYRL